MSDEWRWALVLLQVAVIVVQLALVIKTRRVMTNLKQSSAKMNGLLSVAKTSSERMTEAISRLNRISYYVARHQDLRDDDIEFLSRMNDVLGADVPKSS